MIRGRGIRWVVIAFALCLMLAACTNGNGNGSTASGGKETGETGETGEKAGNSGTEAGSNLTEPGQYPIVNKKEDLSLYITKSAVAFVTDMDKNASTDWIEKKTNIDLTFEIGPEGADEAQQKINLMLASGSKLPDVFLKTNLTNDQLTTYGSQGTFLALNDYIEKYGVNIKKLTEKYPNLLKNMTAPDGNIYALPSVIECQHCMYAQRFWLNQKWLDAVGMKLPETPDELYDVLKAFKGKDLNGNGKQDEIPLIQITDAWFGDLTGYLMNPFTPSNGKAYDWNYMDGDQIKASYMQDGWRDGLKYLKKLYDEGLLDKEAFLLKANQAFVLAGGPDGNRVGAFSAGALSSAMDIGSPGARDEFIALPPLKNAEGKRITPYMEPVGSPAYVITKYADNPVTAFRLGEAMLTDYAADLEWRNFFYGPEGVTWEKAKEGDIGLNGKPALWRWLYIFGQPTDQSWGTLNILYASVDDKGTLATASEGFDQERILFDSSVNDYQPNRVSMVPPPLYFKTDEAMAIAEPKTQILRFVEESIFKFVTGAKNLDSDWDAYLKELDKLGAKGYMNTLQTVYDRQYKS
ncbi:extracellular solute-binding protein [Paenibacillus mendelii]|uniref:Extracellular solute-binding protein n=1 Tax=Paenibacillus mendelii TaxID=206163 RepID=A0ABV6JKR2_9BACL|nr:extracellular solute-binding protein [Paenibacillus mendelii]MCQ6560662.1 extracellular solute-binding protein [Paenibacillus mendelii]